MAGIPGREGWKGVPLSNTNTILTPVANTVVTTIADIVAKVTAQLGAAKAGAFTPLITEYGPAFLKMGADEIVAWIQLAAKGDSFAAQQAILAKMGNDDLVSQWAVLSNDWKTANAANAQAVAFQRNAVAGIVNGLVQIALALVGL